jgi:hypothetical protein
LYLIEIFLPLYDNNKTPFATALFDRVRDELTEKFGGITAFQRSPAHGVWKKGSGRESHDEIVIFEVMAEQIDRRWWTKYRKDLESRFQQEKLVVRVSKVDLL